MNNYQHWSEESLAVVDRFFEVFPEIRDGALKSEYLLSCRCVPFQGGTKLFITQ